MITLSILIVIALICALVGCLMGLFSLVGLLASLVIGVLVGALAGYIAGRFMGTETSFARNAVLGVLGSFVGEFLFGLVGIHATGSFSSFVISILGACVCIWVDNKFLRKLDTLSGASRQIPHSVAIATSLPGRGESFLEERALGKSARFLLDAESILIS